MIYIIYSAMNDENNTILKEYVPKAISQLRTKKKRPDNNSICEYINKKLDTNSKNEDIFTIILSLVDENIITNKPTKQGLPSYFILNEETDNEEEEKEDENSNDDFNSYLLGTTSVDKNNTDSRDESNVKCDQHNLISKDVDEISFLKQSILNINAKIMVIKNFVMNELYSFDRVRTEQCDQTKFMKDMKNLTDENHKKTLIIKTLTENLDTINKERFITNNQNLNKHQCQDSTNNNSFKYPKRFASLPRKINLTNGAEGISVSPNPFQLLEHNNIRYTILDENDSNAHNTMMNPIINTNDNIQVVKRRPAIVINNHPENQNQFKNIAAVPGEKTYSEIVRGRYKPSTLISSDSIPKGIKMYQFNKCLVNNNRAQLISFPGASSKSLLHYLDVHLEDKNINTVILHIGVNDLLNDDSPECVNMLMENLTKMIKKFRMYGVKNILVSSIVYTVELELPLLENVHVKLIDLCQSNNISIIDNRNIRGEYLYKNGLHLLDHGKRILGNILISALNNLYDDNFLGFRNRRILIS